MVYITKDLLELAKKLDFINCTPILAVTWRNGDPSWRLREKLVDLGRVVYTGQ